VSFATENQLHKTVTKWQISSSVMTEVLLHHMKQLVTEVLLHKIRKLVSKMVFYHN
jgi:hypothetical protein